MDIMIERHISPDELLTACQFVIPDALCFVGTDDLQLENSPSHNVRLILQRIDTGKHFGQFGASVSVQLQEGKNYEVWLCGLARMLSKALDTRTIYTGSPSTVDSRNPFYCIVWNQDDAYLGDDSGLDTDEGKTEPVKILRQLDLSSVRFANQLELTSWLDSKLKNPYAERRGLS